MTQTFQPIRYAVIAEKNKREIVMLRGQGCTWRRCRFCDYHLDSSTNEDENYKINRQALSQVTGHYHKLEVVNSGSFAELDKSTIQLIKEICLQKQISQLHVECHWSHRQAIQAFSDQFSQIGITVKFKIGVETFDTLFRECYLTKGIDTDNPKEIAQYFQEICLLQGLPGQTKESMERDIILGLTYFERVCINIMTANSSPIKPDPVSISIFKNELYPVYKDHPQIDILLNNIDFGIGGYKSNV